jgi:hypothetical protein
MASAFNSGGAFVLAWSLFTSGLSLTLNEVHSFAGEDQDTAYEDLVEQLYRAYIAARKNMRTLIIS